MPNVADPTTPIEIWNKHRGRASRLPCRARRRSIRPPSPPRPYLDFDSNANCVIDGRRQENVIFPTGSPPPGVYTVRVDASSLCGQAGRAVAVSATGRRRRNGTLLGYAQWQATDADTRGSSRRRLGPAGHSRSTVPIQ